MSARVGVITFPGSLDDRDAARAVRLAGGDPVALWHADADLAGVDADAVRRTGLVEILGGGRVVGEIRALLP